MSTERGSLLKFFSLIVLVGGLAFFQAYEFSLFGVKPNLALAALVPASFFIADFFEGALLIFISALILKSGIGFESGIAVFSTIGIGIMAVVKFLPWRYFFGNLAVISVAVLLFYAFLAPGLILSAVFLKELILNVVVSSLIFAFLYFLWQDK